MADACACLACSLDTDQFEFCWKCDRAGCDSDSPRCV